MSEKRELIKSLKKGDELRFEARVMSLGNEFKMHHLHAIGFEKTGGFKELSEIIVRESTLPWKNQMIRVVAYRMLKYTLIRNYF